MRLRNPILVAMALGLGAGAPWPAAGSGDFSASRLVHPTDPEWTLLDDLVRRGQLDPNWLWGDATRAGLRRALDSGPTADQLARWLAEGEAGLGLSIRPKVVWGLRGGGEGYRLTPAFAASRGEADPSSRVQTTLDTDIAFTPSLFGHFSFRFDSEGANDPLNRTRTFHQFGVSNNVDRAYLRWQGDALAIVLGRTPVNWGPEPGGSLLLSPVAPALDQLQASLRWGRHRWRVLVGQLSSVELDSVATQHRNLYGHRLDLRLGRLTLGISEIAVVSDPAGALSLRALNPLQFHVQAQVEQDGDSSTQVNVLNSVDGRLQLGSAQLHGSLLIDDLQIDAEGRKRYPHQLAWTGGAEIAGPADARLGYGYRRIGTWTYLHRGLGTDFQHYGRPIGAPEGTDTDAHRAWFRVQPTARWSLEVAGERRRRGVNRLSTSEDRAGHSGEPFPRGTVEKRWLGSVAVAWALPPHLLVRADILAAHLDNSDNIPGVTGDVVEVRLGMEVRARALVWRQD